MLCQVIPPAWLKLFNAQEVNQLLGGGEMGVLDVTDMAAHAQYSGGYSKDNSTIKLFWKVGCSSRCMHYAHMQHHSPVKYGEIRAEDVTDMAQYSRGYSKDNFSIKLFWKVCCLPGHLASYTHALLQHC